MVLPGGPEFTIFLFIILLSLFCLKYLGVFGWLRGRLNRKVIFAAVAVVAILGVASAMGAFSQPSGGVEDIGDWGDVSEDRTEIITTLWVANPNTIGFSSDDLSMRYQIELNQVDLAEGNKQGIDIQPGNNSVQVSTYLINDRIADWWVNYVNNDETITVGASGEVNIGDSVTFGFPEQRETLLEDSTPVITSLSDAARGAEGEYTRSASVGTGIAEESVTVGYEIQEGRATWGTVNEDTTTVLFRFQIRNPGDVAVPAVPDGLGVSVDMNDVRLFRAQGDAFSPRGIGRNAVIQPGETREVVLAVTMDNDEVDEWFTSHVRRGEYSDIAVQLQLVFNVEETGTTLRIPREGGITYQCELQTGMLKDEQATSTTCGDEGSVINNPSSEDESTQTPTQTGINRTAREDIRDFYEAGLETVNDGNNYFEQASQTYDPDNPDTYDQAIENWAQAEQRYAAAAEYFGNAANIASELGLSEVERICRDAQNQALLLESASANYKLSLMAARDGDYEESQRLYREGTQDLQQVDSDAFIGISEMEEMLGI